MKRARPRVPASRRSAQASFVLKLAFTSLVLLLAAAPGCGSSHPTGSAPSEQVGTVSEALTTNYDWYPGFLTGGAACVSVSGSVDCASAADACHSIASLYGSSFEQIITYQPPAIGIGGQLISGLSCNYYYHGVTGQPLYSGVPSGMAGDANSPQGFSPTTDVQPIKQVGSGDDTGDDDNNNAPSTASDADPTPSDTGDVFAGEPVNVASGNMAYHKTDYRTAGQNRLAFTRYFNSRGTYSGTLGVNWRHSYDRVIWLFNYPANTVSVQRADGRSFYFTGSGSSWTTDSDVDYTLTQSGSTYTLTAPNDTVETYTTASGGRLAGIAAQLTTVAKRNGYTLTLAYDSNGQLSTVTDSYSRTLTFTYTSTGQLATLATPDSTTITYGYTSGATPTLSTVTYPTSPASTLTYGYALSALPQTLTSVTDENGNTFLSWTYDQYARALTSQVGTGSTAQITTVSYNDTTGARTVTNPLGVADTYSFTTLQNAFKLTGISRAATSTTAAATESFSYDSNGFIASKTDWNGNTTNWTNNSHGDPTSITEAYGSSVARTTTIAYDTTHVHLPDSITTPGVTTSFTYDSSGNVLTKTLTDTTTTSTPYSTNGQTRTWTNTYSNHLLASVKSPNGNTTSFGYSTSGALTSVTNALSQVTSITSNTGGGRPLTIVDPNSVTTTLTYDPRQRLLTSAVTMSVGTRTTTYTYDAAGELTQTTLPDSSYLANTFDTAHRVTKVTNANSDYTTYTLDALGDRTATNVYHSYGSLYAQHGGTFDALGRLITDTGGRGQTTTYTFDKNGNALTVTDGNSHTTTNTFDALNRLSTSTDANGGVVSYIYDTHNRVTSVTDPLGHATTYVYDGFGDVIQQTIPDTGTTVYHYDSDGNLTQKVDAASVTVNQTFDALDRQLTRSYPADSTQNVSFTYDSTGWPYGDGIGRLTGVADAAGYEFFGYDERGETTFQRRTYLGTNYDIYPVYDAAGRYNGSDYPSGMWGGIVARNAAGQVAEAAVFPTGSGSYDVLAWMGTGPFGPMDYITYGNGVTGHIWRDYDYNISSIDLTNWAGTTTLQNVSYTLDGANNVTAITDAVNGANTQTLGYDVINRLTAATSGTGGYGSQSWTLDKNGNTTAKTLFGTTFTYALASGTNQLASASYTGSNTETFTYNANGNITAIAKNGTTTETTSYNVANRAASFGNGTSTLFTNTYGFDGHRVAKTAGSTTTLYIYGIGGELLEERTGSNIIDYVYVEGRPLGMFFSTAGSSGSGTLYYVLPDRQGRPNVVTDSSASVAWSGTYDPFGDQVGGSGSLTQNLGFPGQYVDDPSNGIVQNWNRDYNPTLGRFDEADLIGLGGGLNPYAYARGNPLTLTDPAGLNPDDVPSVPDLTSGFDDFGREVNDIFGNGTSSAPSPSVLDQIQSWLAGMLGPTVAATIATSLAQVASSFTRQELMGMALAMVQTFANNTDISTGAFDAAAQAGMGDAVVTSEELATRAVSNLVSGVRAVSVADGAAAAGSAIAGAAGGLMERGIPPSIPFIYFDNGELDRIINPRAPRTF